MGWARREIGFVPRGHAMSGYGMWHHRAETARTPLLARALVIGDESGRRVVLCCLDMAMVTHAMRSRAAARLSARLGEAWDDEGFVLTCTHTHSSPGGCGYEAMYNIVTPGFVPEHLEAVTVAIFDAVLAAWESASPSELSVGRTQFPPSDEVAWNRSIAAHRRNPEATITADTDTHLAIDRELVALAVRRDGSVGALLSLFGVHATCIGNDHDAHDGDNKGRAARRTEEVLEGRGIEDPVALFAQATAGDVSPHYHGPGQQRRRRATRRDGDPAYAERNGRVQSERSLDAADGADEPLTGPVDAVMTYTDFVDLAVPSRFADGRDDARTSEPCHGNAFFQGTPVDGPGAPGIVGVLARWMAGRVRRRRLAGRVEPERLPHHTALYAAQDPKDIVLEAGAKRLLGRPLDQPPVPERLDPTVAEMTRQARSGALDRSPLVPTVLPTQVVRIGSLAIVCCPGEFTTVAGARLRDTIREELDGTGIRDVLVMTYCNDYMGYVTTPEEYAEQAYEGGHTVFGRHTLGAFRSVLADLAAQLGRDRDQRTHDADRRPPPVPAEELALRSDLR